MPYHPCKHFRPELTPESEMIALVEATTHRRPLRPPRPTTAGKYRR